MQTARRIQVQKPRKKSALDAMTARAKEWVGLPAATKLRYLREILANVGREAEAWAAASVAVRGGAPPDGVGREALAAAWMAGVVPTASVLQGLIRSYEGLARDRAIPEPPSSRFREDGRMVVQVFPHSAKDRGFAPGYRGELWLAPGATGSRGGSLRAARPAVSVILGAGNYEAPSDILSRMFVHDRVVIYKPNPVNEAQVPVLHRILAPLVDAGYLLFAESDTKTAQRLLKHPAVDEVFMTGSQATHDRIVWGHPGRQAANKLAGVKTMDKPFECELGGVSPAVVVPGEWTDAELEHQAAQLAAAKLLNGGHICSSLQVVVVSKRWPQKNGFLERLRVHLRHDVPTRSYYPGTAGRIADLARRSRDVEWIENEHPVPGSLDLAYVRDAQPGDPALTEEAFGPLLAVVELDFQRPEAFLAAAARLCNDELYGNLSATLIVDPRTARQHEDSVERAVAELRYGAIGVNVWGGYLFFIGDMVWGGHPGNTADDIGSGVGWIHNGYLLDRVQKGVLWTPMVSPAHPHPARARDDKIYPRIGRFLLDPSWGGLAKVLSGVVLGA